MFSNSERSPKRQRQSYSPASPAADTKTLSSAFVQPPQTPPPSVRMSPSWQSQQAQANGAASTSGSVTFPTPPSTAGFPSQAAALSVMGDTREGGEDHSRRQTPDHEGENEKKRKRDMEIGEDEGRTPYKRHHGEGEHKQQDELVDAGYRRTDHERHVGAEEDGDSKAQHEQGPAAPAPKIYKLCADRKFTVSVRLRLRTIKLNKQPFSHPASAPRKTSSLFTPLRPFKHPSRAKTLRGIRSTSCASPTKTRLRPWDLKDGQRHRSETPHWRACWILSGICKLGPSRT